MNKIKNAFSKIKASDEYKNAITKNLQTNPIKSKSTINKSYYKPAIIVATILLVIIGVVMTNTRNKSSINSVSIDKIELPKGDGAGKGKMLPLIVYKKNIYTLSATTIDPKNSKKLLGEKLGTTKDNLNEWSKQKDYAKEFASTIGKQDIYSVKGYDKDFRIMTNTLNQDGTTYPQFYDCLNGITVNNGSDIFEKLKLKGNVVTAKFRLFSDWNNGVDVFYPIKDTNLINKFVKALNTSTPYLQESLTSLLGDYQNDSQYRELTLELKDGCKVTISFLKSGYVYYGSQNVYFKIDSKISDNLWSQLNIK